MIEADVRLAHQIEVISFSDEEGRFGGMLGSEAFTGRLTPDRLLGAMDLGGVKLANAMRERGSEPTDSLDARREPSSIHAFLELHIEQGPVLDQTRQQVGIEKGSEGGLHIDTFGSFVPVLCSSGLDRRVAIRKGMAAIGDMAVWCLTASG